MPQANRCATHTVEYLHRKGIDYDIISFCIEMSRLDNIFTILNGMKNHPLTYDDDIIRKILKCVVVESKQKIKVIFTGGLEIENEVEQ